MLEHKTTLSSKTEVLKIDYPGVFEEYCKHFGLQEELDQYVKECMSLREAGPLKSAQFYHGGVLPTL